MLALACGLATSGGGDALAVASTDLHLAHRALMLACLAHEAQVTLAFTLGTTLTSPRARETVGVGFACQEAVLATVCHGAGAFRLVEALGGRDEGTLTMARAGLSTHKPRAFVFACVTKVTILTGTSGLTVDGHACPSSATDLPARRTRAFEVTSLSVTPCFAGAGGSPELVQVAATVATAHFAVGNGAALVASGTQEALFAFACCRAVLGIGRARSVSRAWISLADSRALKLTLGSLALVGTLAGWTIDGVEEAGADLGTATCLVVVHWALTLTCDANPAATSLAGALGSWF